MRLPSFYYSVNAGPHGVHTGPQAFREWVSEAAYGKIKLRVRAAQSGWANLNQLIDGDVGSKADSPGTVVGSTRQAWVEFDLPNTYTLKEVRMAEDNAGSAHVDSYTVQCWTGTGWVNHFTDTSTTVAQPRMDEHPLSAGCTTNRLRVYFYNNGGVEPFEFEVYGKAAGIRTFTIATEPSHCSTSSLAKGTHNRPAGANQGSCANPCGDYVFEGWHASSGIWLSPTSANCTTIQDLRESGTMTAVYHPATVAVRITHNTGGVITSPTSLQVPWDSTTEVTTRPDDGLVMQGFRDDVGDWHDTGGGTTSFSLSHLRKDSDIYVQFGPDSVGITAVVSSGNGSIGRAGDPSFTGGGFIAEAGSTVLFTFAPDPGYHVQRVCPSRLPECIEWSQNSYALEAVRSEDFWFDVEFAPN